MLNTPKKSSEMMEKHSWTETGTIIFAFLNVITASFGLLICLGVLVLYIYEEIMHTDTIDIFLRSACLSTNFVAILSFVFAIVLYLGVNRKKPCFVLAYFIFGVIVEITVVCGLVALQQNLDSFVNKKLHEAFYDYYEPFVYGTIAICAVYPLLLTMICRTWFLMTSRRSDDHVKLVNDYYESDWRPTDC